VASDPEKTHRLKGAEGDTLSPTQEEGGARRPDWLVAAVETVSAESRDTRSITAF
jgi:hypothetical protein